MYNKGDTLSFDNNLEYLVLEIIDYMNNSYLYLMNSIDKHDIALVKQIKENDKVLLQNIDNDTEFTNVLIAALAKNKETIINELDHEN